MYGLPNYNEFDPTIFVALTYSFIFGWMFGDVGQGLVLVIGGFLLYHFKKMNLAAIISMAGVFSTFFGFMFGSIFGFEDVIEPIWLRPMSKMTDLPMIGRLNTVFIVAVAFGMGMILLTMIIHIINAAKNHSLGDLCFDTNGIAGLVFYGLLVFAIVMLMTGHSLPGGAAVILGQAKQSSDQPNIARLAALITKFPLEVQAYTVHRQCGSGMQAVQNAAQEIMCGYADFVLAGGVESMSNAQYYLREARRGYAVGNGILLDPNTESQPRSQPADQYGVLTMGMTAENIAEKYVISRTAQDYFACESQEKAQAAIKSGRFDDEIEPLPVKKKKEILMFAADEHPRLSTIEKLSELKPAFKKDGSVTAGNASGRNDGGAMLLIAEESAAAKAGLKPMAKIISQASIGVSPAYMGMGPVPATRLALKRAGLRIEDIGLIEINEAFAAQSLAVIQELEIDLTRVNVNGGAIALGHPIGCSGARILVTLLHEMQKRQVRYGLATLCIAGGLGSATVLELV